MDLQFPGTFSVPPGLLVITRLVKGDRGRLMKGPGIFSELCSPVTSVSL